MAVERGCGFREEGGVYMECPTSSVGQPVEHFLFDPPRPFDPSRAGVTPRGVKVVELSGVHHVIDWIGSEHYPNVADFIEEVRRHGLSRRITGNADFHLLTPESKILVMHARAQVDNAVDYHDAEYLMMATDGTTHGCPKCLQEHEPHHRHAMCARYWWQDIEGGEPVDDGASRTVDRAMPSFTYRAKESPEVKTKYSTALFGAFPIANLAVIRAADGSHERTAARASEATLPVTIEEA